MRIFQWLAIVGMTLFLPVSVLAVNLGATDLGNAGMAAQIDTAGAQGNLVTFAASIVVVVLNVLGALLFILFVYSGFLWTTAAGDSKQVDKAKTIMKNAVIGLVVTLFSGSVVFFVELSIPGGSTTLWSSDSATLLENSGLSYSLSEDIGTLIKNALNLLGAVLLVLFIYAGFLWATAAGDSKQVDKAKTIMKNALIGLIITLLARGIASFVVQQLESAEVAYTSSLIHNVPRV